MKLFWQKNKETRPWGKFEALSTSPDFYIKKITVNPGKRLSYQSHAKRNEHWYIISGTGKVIINDQSLEATTGKSFDIQALAKHRIENTDNKADLVFIEISTGHFDENDIVRFDDDFGRAGK
jgi:mannose-6-phosphate isomerase